MSALARRLLPWPWRTIRRQREEIRTYVKLIVDFADEVVRLRDGENPRHLHPVN